MAVSYHAPVPRKSKTNGYYPGGPGHEIILDPEKADRFGKESAGGSETDTGVQDLTPMDENISNELELIREEIMLQQQIILDRLKDNQKRMDDLLLDLMKHLQEDQDDS